MRLELENGTELSNPTAADIRSALGTVGNPGNSFAILSQADAFVQTAGNDRDGFILEWHGQGRHLQADASALSREQVEQAFVGFSTRSPEWSKVYSWKPVNLGGRHEGSHSPRRDVLDMLSVAGWIIVAAFGAYFLYLRYTGESYQPLIGQRADILVMLYSMLPYSFNVLRNWHTQTGRSRVFAIGMIGNALLLTVLSLI